jgi:acetyltransferase-like isoleucine patch superfamily enzyme
VVHPIPSSVGNFRLPQNTPSRVRFVLDEPMWRLSLMAKLMRPLRERQFGHLGEGSIVYRPDWLYGTQHMSIGDRVVVMRGAWLAVERSAWDRDEPVLRIGNGVGIRSNATISAATSVVIEDDVVFGGSVTVVDSDHTWNAGQPNVLHNPTEASPIRIGRGTWLGDRTTVLRGADIGEFCMIGAHSVVRGHIPDHSVAVGSPAKVVGKTNAPVEGGSADHE